jgi:hypothetical protein
VDIRLRLLVRGSEPVVRSGELLKFSLRLRLRDGKFLDPCLGPFLGNGEPFFRGSQISNHLAEFRKVPPGDDVVVGFHDELRQQLGLLFIEADQKAVLHFGKVAHGRSPAPEGVKSIFAKGKQAGKRRQAIANVDLRRVLSGEALNWSLRRGEISSCSDRSLHRVSGTQTRSSARAFDRWLLAPPPAEFLHGLFALCLESHCG